MSDDVARIGDRGDVIFGIRPEHFRKSGNQSSLNIKCSVVEPLGAHTLVIGRVGDQKITAQVDPRFNVVADTDVSVGVDMSQAHFFDATTEMRL